MSQPRTAPLLSILIPTKNRYETLHPVVSALLGRISDPRLELVLCDNSSDPKPDKVQQLIQSDARISYHHSDEHLSQSANTERGIGFCTGDYICFIGDDDLVSPHIVQVVEWLEGQDADCLVFPPATYWWSNIQFAKESRYRRPGAFWLPKRRDGSARWLRTATELGAVLARGGVAYMNLPRLYHGIASRRAMERVHDRFGRYVPGSSPDMALCVALGLTNDRYLSIDYPVSVFGASRNSGGGWSAARKHYGPIEEQKHLPRDIIDNWDPLLPRIWSEQIIYPQTIHEVMSRGGEDRDISYLTLYSSLIAYEPHVFSYLWPLLVDRITKHPADLPQLLSKTALKLAGRARTAVRSAYGWGMPFDLDCFADVATVMEFMAQLPPPAALTNASAGPA